MGTEDPPKGRNPVKDYRGGIEVYKDEVPGLVDLEHRLREDYDPARIEQQQRLEDIYGPRRTGEVLERIEELDPEGQAVRSSLAEQIYKDIEDPYAMPDDLRIEAENDFRGAQTARGNFLGNGASMAEALYKGKIRNDLANQRMIRAGAFLSGPSPVTQSSYVQPVQPDRSAAYTPGGPQAGMQGANLGQMAFGNAMQQYTAQQQQPNYWMEALKIAGTAAASYYSDERLKNSIEDTGEKTKDGIPIVTFCYNGIAQRYKGVIAQIAQQFRPDAVFERNGRLMVNYEALGLQMVEVD